MTPYQQFIHLSRYARFIEEENRRETWPETVQRYCDFFRARHPGDTLILERLDEAQQAIENMEVMPSMRCMMTAGKALDRSNVAGYNCAYVAVDHPKVFDETLYVLMCGTGVGYSVERQFIQKLPEVSDDFHETDTVVKVRDSKKGWANAYRELLSLLWQGQVPTWDMSAVRPAGARLKTFGGRASGPAPLEDLFRFSVALFRKAQGRKLSSLECHDLMCKVAEIVVVGGVRRSALISLSNLSDQRMRDCKSGEFWNTDSQRALANNSVCYTEKPDFPSFLNEMHALHKSKSGERGVFNRVAAKEKCESIGRDSDHEFGCNPCSEIILRPAQFCNLSEIVARAGDDDKSLERKARIAAFLGTLQSTLTDFDYLRPIWKRNTEEERLLGVSITGIHDCLSLLGSPNYLGLRKTVHEENHLIADHLGIPRSAAMTCVKPSGTVSQLTDSSSGMHTRYAPYYIRRVRGDVKDPLTKFMQDAGVPWEPDVTKPDSTVVFSFPQKAPDTDADSFIEWRAMDQMYLWDELNSEWCDHKPSVTIEYTDSDFLDIQSFLWRHFDSVSGISLLPRMDAVYQQSPYEEITQEEFETLNSEMPEIDFSAYTETDDGTTASQELACTAGGCEIDTI